MKKVRMKSSGIKSSEMARVRIKRMLIVMLGAAMILLLGGCSLAKKDAGNKVSKDRMIGAFITNEYLDLFDIEAYFDDHVSSISDGEEITLEDSSKYNERLYATIDKHGSKDPADWDISFGDVEGINFFSVRWEDESKEATTSLVESDGIYDVNTSYNITDEGEQVELSGTIYMLPGLIDEDTAYFVNPVYQTEDGQIYVVSESGGSTSGNTSEGEQFALTISDETTVTASGYTGTENVGNVNTGNAKSEKMTVTVRLSVVYEPVKITLYQMDKKNCILQKDDYIPGEMPEKLEVSKECEYLLIETEKKDPDGEMIISRDLYEQGEEGETLDTFYRGEGGKLSKQSTEIIW